MLFFDVRGMVTEYFKIMPNWLNDSSDKTNIDPRLVAEALAVTIKGEDFAVVSNDSGVWLRRN